MVDCTYSEIHKEFMQDSIVGEAFQFVIQDEDDDELCILNATQKEH